MTIPPPEANAVALLAWLMGAAGGLGALAVIGRYVRRVALWARRTAIAIDTLHTIVERELTTNGGTSMKDRLDEQCVTMRRHLEQDDAVQAATLARVEAMEQKLNDVWYRITGLRR